MARPYSAEFRRRVAEFARQGEHSIRKVDAGLGIAVRLIGTVEGPGDLSAFDADTFAGSALGA